MHQFPNCELPPNTASIVSFEQRVVDAGDVRAACLLQALASQQIDLGIDASNAQLHAQLHSQPYSELHSRLRSQLDGRTFEESIATLLHDASQVIADPTLATLTALDADARFTSWLRDGAVFHANWSDLVSAVTNGSAGRMVLRADSRRRDVIPFLERWHLHDVFAMIRCADDPPLATSQYRSTFCRSWEAILDRFTRWGVDPSHVQLFEGASSHRTALQLLSGGHVSEFGD